MKLDGLCIKSCSAEDASKLVKAIENLPEGTITGEIPKPFPLNVSYSDGNVKIMKPSDYERGFISFPKLTVKIPEGAEDILCSEHNALVCFNYKDFEYYIQI